MNDIKFEKISGEGKEVLYNLYFHGKLVRSEIPIDEVTKEIEDAYEKGIL